MVQSEWIHHRREEGRVDFCKCIDGELYGELIEVSTLRGNNEKVQHLNVRYESVSRVQG